MRSYLANSCNKATSSRNLEPKKRKATQPLNLSGNFRFSCSKIIEHKIFHNNFVLFCREQVDNLTGEIERLKRSLAAKEDVERSQIEAVHQLTARVKKQDAEILAIKEVRDYFQKLAESSQETLDNTQK